MRLSESDGPESLNQTKRTSLAMNWASVASRPITTTRRAPSAVGGLEGLLAPHLGAALDERPELDAELGGVGADLRGVGHAIGGAEGEVHQRRHGPAQGQRAEHPVGYPLVTPMTLKDTTTSRNHCNRRAGRVSSGAATKNTAASTQSRRFG